MTATDSSGFDVLCSYDADGNLVGAALAGRAPVKMDTVTFDTSEDAADYVSGAMCPGWKSRESTAGEGGTAASEEPSGGQEAAGLIPRTARHKTRDRYYSLLPDKFIALNLTQQQWLVLMYLLAGSDRHGATRLPQVLIAEDLKMHRQNVGRAVATMARKGIFTVTVDKLRRRTFKFNPELLWNYSLDERNHRLGRVTYSAEERREMKRQMKEQARQRGAA